jgi:hypothetical protein
MVLLVTAACLAEVEQLHSLWHWLNIHGLCIAYEGPYFCLVVFEALVHQMLAAFNCRLPH